MNAEDDYDIGVILHRSIASCYLNVINFAFSEIVLNLERKEPLQRKGVGSL